jgi:hypothetical protein
MASMRFSRSHKEPFGRGNMAYARPIPEELVVSREAKALKTLLTETMPPTPITPGFGTEEHNLPQGVQETIEEFCKRPNNDQGCTVNQVEVPHCRVRRRLILHSSNKAAPRSKLSSRASIHDKPTLHDLAHAAEHHHIAKHIKHNKISMASKKRVRVILKKTVLPRTLNDQITHTLIESYQTMARADELIATRNTATVDDESS